jgi:hypothetical protein
VNSILRPGAGVLFMKIGVHAREPLDAIIERKLKEIERTGYALWGYGGSTCHPTSMVQPFSAALAREGQPIYLCMNKMESTHSADPIRATHCSADELTWEVIPDSIDVIGSRFALKIRDLRPEDFRLPLSKATVAVGPSLGMQGSRYISGRVDKACFRLADGVDVPADPKESAVDINLVAELESPYAVFLKNVS